MKKPSDFKKQQRSHELFSLMNVGQATFRDLEILNIQTIEKLSQAHPDELYKRLQQLTGRSHDPCVWDVFSAIIHEARTGEKTPWYKWTAVRKKRQKAGTF
ncbi:MAG: helix-hairpin-helix domain-containing protein [Alphaproteobacteria bacterium]|nr:helix-hairpin-helix domain-containing protein [Alphaproteobacteria bacterium]